jgi:hypothetical protein
MSAKTSLQVAAVSADAAAFGYAGRVLPYFKNGAFCCAAETNCKPVGLGAPFFV